MLLVPSIGAAGPQDAELLDRFLGEWEGTGTLFGNPAEFDMLWDRTLGDAFYRLQFENRLVTADGVQPLLRAEAYYRPADDGGIVGTWFDTRGYILPLRGSVEDATLTILWGSPETEQGRTEYRLLEDGGMHVSDFVLRGEEYAPFGEATYRHAASQPELASTLLQRCNVLTMQDDAVRPGHDVLIRGSEIVAIGPSGTLEAPEGAAQVDCDGGYLLPGLTDAHVHLADASELLSHLRYGVTTVFNLGGDYLDLFNDERIEVRALRDAVNAGEMVGARVFSAGQSLDGDPATGPYQRALATPAAAAEAVREQVAEGWDFVKVYDAVPADTHAAIIEAAHQAGVPVFGHVAEPVGVEATLSSGQRVVAHAEELYPVLEEADDLAAEARAVALRARDAGVYLIPNTAFIRHVILQLEDLEAELARPDVAYLAPRVRVWWEPRYNWYVGRDNPEEFLARMRARYEWMLPAVAAMHQAGVPLLAGSDASVPGALPGDALHEELEDLVRAGLTPYEALRAATANAGAFAARHLPKAAPFGILQPGARADLMLVADNPLEDIGHLRNLQGVMAGGVWHTPEALLARLQEATGQAPALPDPDPRVLLGAWRVDLRPTPDAEPYYQDMQITSVDGGAVEGTFYGSPMQGGRLNVDWGAIRFAFVTGDGSGAYHTSGVLEDGKLTGTTHSLGREFLSVWSAERIESQEPR